MFALAKRTFGVYFIQSMRTVFAGDVGEVEDVEVAALRSPTAAEGRVDLSNSDGGAGGQSEERELHYDWR